jgi:hypothetical protein
VLASWTIVGLLAGCAPSATPSGEAALGPVDRLVRVSMALRGVRPTAAELRAAVAEPDLIGVYADAWLRDPLFGETVREIHDHAWRMSTDIVQLPASGSLAGAPMARIKAGVLGGPARLAEHVVTHDLPYTETVLADWFVADGIAAAAWPDVEGYDADLPDDVWQVVQWGDGRPLAGLLSDSGLWLRYRSPNANYNRTRANALSRALLCHDFLEIATDSVDASVDLSNLAAAENAIATVPVCVACHQDLDGLAGFLPFDPFWPVPSMVFPYGIYDPAYDEQWREMTGRPPVYFGAPGDDLSDLGQAIAADPRFAECAARRFYGWFAQLRPADVPADVAIALHDVLVDSGYDARRMARAAVLSEELAAAGTLVATPRQLARTVEALTGFRWEVDVTTSCCEAQAGSSPYGLVDLSTDQYVGFDVVGGGYDGDGVLDPKRTLSTTGTAFQRRLAERAGAYVVEEDFHGVSPRLLTFVDVATTDENAIRRQLVELHAAILAELVEPDDEEIDRTYELWVDTVERSDVKHAWRVVLTAMLRDMRVATY